ncbi:DUF1338 domain-containing protein [Marinilongibacter aquaticus]|uniref:DUF1338 domain-containing protein n=1 Tax=Marinilongibacter aquaticus TaxID=2975157 RepID=UPI0021BDCFBA|nr:DUF1338 domain-containing protein [Marinilongibacter aquaticus]UBM60476.1 DUF1338 domain-containing protein [Marinilongibacter aquaticus]
MKSKELDKVLQAIFEPYRLRVPNVQKITLAMQEKGMIDRQEDIENDHIAFRTMGVPHLGVASLEKIFLHYGYKKRDYYRFEGKKLNSWWFSPPDDQYPRIFISELIVEELSPKAQQAILKYTSPIDKDPVDALNLSNPEEVGAFFQKPLWRLPNLEDYQLLQNESEYAAWVIYNRYYLNHYTISVHKLPMGYNKLEQFNAFLESIGIKLNDSGGKIKTSADSLLRQSSTVAEMVVAEFESGEKCEIPGSYVEFAERNLLPEFTHLPQDERERKHYRDGFEAGNADKIFESTYTSQTLK